MRDIFWQNWVVGTAILIALLFYGLQQAPYTPQGAEPEITVVLGGDVNMGRKIGQQLLAGNIDYPFAKISNTLKEADIAFVNLESQLADLGGETQSPTNEYRFAGPPEGAQSLKNAGIDIVSVANNHMWDYGKDHLFETLDHLDSSEIKYIGASKSPDQKYTPVITNTNGIKIGWLAMTTLLNGYEKPASEYVSLNSEKEIISEIEKIKNNVDYIFVSIHTGTEYKTSPNKDMVELSHRLIDAGADIIIGHHPHVPQPIEHYISDSDDQLASGHRGTIFYSLGNFAFWQPFSFWTEHSFLAKLSLTKRAYGIEIIPINSGWQPEINTNDSDISKINELLYSPY